jgi:hypothetical protein
MLIFWLKFAVRRQFDERFPEEAQWLTRPRRKVVHAGQDDEEQWRAGRVPLRQEAARWRRLILDIMSSLHHSTKFMQLICSNLILILRCHCETHKLNFVKLAFSFF